MVLSGSFTMFVDWGAGPQDHGMARRRRDGFAAVFARGRPPGDSVAQEPSEILEVHGDRFRELIEQCTKSRHPGSRHDRSRPRLHLERPARREDGFSRKAVRWTRSRVEQPAGGRTQRRAAHERLEDSQRAARALGTFSLTETQLGAVDAAREACLCKQQSGVRSPIEQAEREEAMADWLADRGLDIASRSCCSPIRP